MFQQLNKIRGFVQFSRNIFTTNENTLIDQTTIGLMFTQTARVCIRISRELLNRPEIPKKGISTIVVLPIHFCFSD